MREPSRASLLLLVPGAFLAVLLSAFDVYNTDIGFHLAHGEWILDHREVPRTSVLSERFGDRPWHDDKWLFQAGAALVHRLDGPRGLVLVRISLVLVLWSSVVLAAGARRPVAALLLGSIALVAMSERFLFRPELASYAFLSIFVLALDRFVDRGGRSVWLLLPLQILWANVHSYFMFGYLVVWVVLAGRTAGWWLSGRKEPLLAGRRGTLFRLAIATTLGSLAQPTPIQGGFFPWWSLYQATAGEYAVTKSFITEFEPAWRWGEFPTSSQLAFAGLAATAFLVLVLRRRQARFEDWALASLFLAGGILLRRNMALFGALGGVLAASVWRRGPMPGPRIRLATGCAALVATLAILPSVASNRLAAHDRLPRRLGLGRSDLVLPDQAADFVLERRLEGACFNDFSIGGWLLLRWGREREPFIDGNMGAYPLSYLLEYHDVMTGRISPAAVCERHGVEYFVLSTATSDTADLLRRIHRDPAFALVHLDPVAAVYVRRDGPNANVARESEILLDRLEAGTELLEADPPERGEPWWSWFDPRPVPETHPEVCLGQFFHSLGTTPRLARRWYLEAVRKGSRDPKVLLWIGMVERDLGRLEASRRWIEASLRAKPDYSVAHYHLGLTHRELRDPEGAARAFGRAAELDPGRPDYALALGEASLEAGRPEDAARAFERALEEDEALDRARLGLGRTLAELGREEEALPYLERAALADDLAVRAEAEYWIGRIREARGERDEARRRYEAAVRLRPDREEYLEALQRVR